MDERMKFNSVGISGEGKRGSLWGLGTLMSMLFLVLVLLAGLVTACPKTDSNGTNGTSPPPPAFPVTVTDHLGRQVTIEAEPQKIVSLAPSNTEIVYALGLEDRLVGVTSYCDYPEAAKEKPILGGFTTVDIEKVLEIQPDLVLAAGLHEAEVIPSLERLGLTVLTLDASTLEEVLEAITLAGKCTGKEDEASQLVAEMRNRIKAVTDKTANLTETERPRVFYITWHNPLMTIGSDKAIHDLIVLAGGINIAQHLTGYPALGLEAVIYANPQVIIAGVAMGTGEDLSLQWAMNEPRLASVDARINNRVYGLITDFITRPGPRIVDGLELMAKLIHPEIFG